MSTPKPFQLATIEAALAAFGPGNARRRFLVADEVGLGKTVVAEGIVQRLAAKARRQLVVFYVANGPSVANQNKQRIVEFMEAKAREKATRTPGRLSLIAASPVSDSPIVVYALTPQTSFPGAKSQLTGGQAIERAYIDLLLAKAYPAVSRSLGSQFMQLNAWSSWSNAIKAAKTRLDNAAPGLVERFREAVAREFGTPAGPALRQAAMGRPHHFIGRLRRALALSCLLHQPPDLVIFDEFQRYRTLLAEGADADPLIGALLSPRGRGPAVLLLSATPYRLLATRWEESRGIQAHEELFKLIEFLGGPAVRNEAEASFSEFGDALREVAAGARDGGADIDGAVRRAVALRDRLRTLLGPIVARTERDGVAGPPTDEAAIPLAAPLEPEDVAVFRHLARSLGAKQRAEALAYWSSVPLPAQSLGPRYAAWRNGSFRSMRGLVTLSHKSRNELAPPTWPDAKLRALSKAASAQQLALPWVAPSLPWWRLGGRWAQMADPKLLMFSRFKATPPSVAALLSFGAEAHWLRHERGGYDKVYSRRRLKHTDTPGPVMAAFHPSPWLIQNTDPARAAGATAARVRRTVRNQLVQALRQLKPPIIVDASTARARRRHRSIGRLLPAIEQNAGLAHASAAAWAAIAGRDANALAAAEAWRQAPQITSISPAELDELTEYALCAPGVIAGRALQRHAKDACQQLPSLVRLCWQGLRAYFDNPVFLASLKGATPIHALMRATFEGSFESVLDEHFWLRSKKMAEAAELADDLRQSLLLTAGGFHFHAVGGQGARIRLRCHAAVPFGDAEATQPEPGNDDQAAARPDEIRRSFNTPFWPHVLATTSVGQEGLDFHPWCARVAHWDLTTNPLDLEQREGRVQRFAGLSVRRALADRLTNDVCDIMRETPGSPWAHLAALADERHSDASGLAPWWIMDGAKVARHIFARPFGRDAVRFAALREQRFIYRLALGQPNQEDLLDVLAKGGEAARALLSPLVLDLSAMGLRSNVSVMPRERA